MNFNRQSKKLAPVPIIEEAEENDLPAIVEAVNEQKKMGRSGSTTESMTTDAVVTSTEALAGAKRKSTKSQKAEEL